MRAAVMRNVGDERLDIVDGLEAVPPRPGQVKVKIEATGVCHTDLSVLEGVIPQMAPAVLGHEGAGVVIEVGDGVSTLREGDHVILAWSPPCGSCVYCTRNKAPHLCSEVQMSMMMTPNFLDSGLMVSGLSGLGTFAEEVTVPHQAAIKIDDDIPFEIASLIGCGVMTGVGAALNTAKVTPGSHVVVFGCGGVGIAAIQGARVAGAATITGVDLVEAKLDDAKRFGATHATTPAGLSQISGELTAGQGFDFALECIGNPATMRAAFDSVRRGGTACIVGVGRADETFALSAFELFYSEKTLVGSYYGSGDVRSDFHRMLDLWRYEKLDLAGMISHRIKIDDINGAFDALKRGEVIRQVISF